MLITKPYLRIRRPSPTTAEFIVSTRPPLTIPLRLLLLLAFLLRIALALAALLLLHAKWLQSPYATITTTTTAASESAVPSGSPLSTTYPPLFNDAAQGSSRPYLFSDAFIWHVVAQAHASRPGRLVSAAAAALPAWALLPLALGLLSAAARRAHTTESLLVLRGLGIQTGSSAATYSLVPLLLLPPWRWWSRLVGGDAGSAGDAGATGGGGSKVRFIPTAQIRDVLINEAFRGFEVRYYLAVVVEGEEDVVVVFPKLLPKREIVEKVWRGVRACLYEPNAGRVGDDKG